MASRRASSVSTTPSIVPVSSIKRTGVMRMRSLMRGPKLEPESGRDMGGRRGGNAEMEESFMWRQ